VSENEKVAERKGIQQK